MNKNLNVVELFAGVGGFRVGLEKADKNLFDTVWANQWEPSKKLKMLLTAIIHTFHRA